MIIYIMFSGCNGGSNNMNEDTRSTDYSGSTPPQRDSAQQDKLQGGAQAAGGRLKESAGALTGNERMKAEGERDQLAGKARQKKGKLKDRIKGWIDRQ
jgi:uncharacterized protein YjbJ (UPF0337 family)